MEIQQCLIEKTIKNPRPRKVCLQRIEYKLVRERAIYEHLKKIGSSRDINSSNQIVCLDLIAVGTLDSASVSIRQVIKTALFTNATRLVTVHNHPAGDPQPSSCDDKITLETNRACMIFEIKYLDHLIIGYNSYFSYTDEGKNTISQKGRDTMAWCLPCLICKKNAQSQGKATLKELEMVRGHIY